MIRRYELMIILDASQSDDDIKKQIEKIKEMITSNDGEIVHEDIWGKKRLAYEVKGKQFGYYVVLEFEATPAVPKELDHYARIESTVVRHMILHIEDKVLKMKERETELKSSLETRRKKMAEQSDDSSVVDMLEETPEVEKVAEAKAEEPAKEEKVAEKKEEAVKADEKPEEKPAEKE